MVPLMNGEQLLDRADLARRWHCSKNAIAEKEAEGTLTRVSSEYGAPPTILYRLSDILRIENGDDASALTAWERQQLEAENARLREQVQKLTGFIQEISVKASLATAAAIGGYTDDGSTGGRRGSGRKSIEYCL